MKRGTLKNGLLVVIVCCVCWYALSLHSNVFRLPSFRAKAWRSTRTRSNTTKTILFWNTMFGQDDFYFGHNDPFAECPVNDCYATNDRTDVIDFDAVLFHGNELDANDLPERRSPRQRYIYVNLESPEYREVPAYFSRGYFNLTMTYRLDSDILWSYGVVLDRRTSEITAPLGDTSWRVHGNSTDEGRSTPEDAQLSAIIGRKKKQVCWFVSNCRAKSGRQDLVEELSKHVEVDVYGKCGARRCAKSVDCLRVLVEPRYFFYLSLENSLCRDYVTEKLYDALRYHAVPIVYGGANYTAFAPPGSYINALDFDTPMDLADYLKSLMRDPQEYRKYFAWKKQYHVAEGTASAKCRLCAYLHANREPKTYESLSDWYATGACPIQGLLAGKAYATRSIVKDVNSGQRGNPPVDSR